MIRVYQIRVRPGAATKPAELVDIAIANVFVSDSFPDQEDAARTYLAKHGYQIEEIEAEHELEPALLRENEPQLYAALQTRGVVAEIIGAP